MRAVIQVRGGVGFVDGDFAIAITNIHTKQSTVPPIAFPTREAAQGVVDAIVRGAPALYTGSYPWTEEGDVDWCECRDRGHDRGDGFCLCGGLIR